MRFMCVEPPRLRGLGSLVLCEGALAWISGRRCVSPCLATAMGSSMKAMHIQCLRRAESVAPSRMLRILGPYLAFGRVLRFHVAKRKVRSPGVSSLYFVRAHTLRLYCVKPLIIANSSSRPCLVSEEKGRRVALLSAPSASRIILTCLGICERFSLSILVSTKTILKL